MPQRAETNGERIRVTLQWIQILDKLDPGFQETGEFRFISRISADGASPNEVRFPEKGHYSISDHPAWNRIGLEKVLFEGHVSNRLEIELSGEEIDLGSANDELALYRRSFEGSPDTWLGRYRPDAEAPDDPESMSNWRVSYVIDRA